MCMWCWWVYKGLRRITTISTRSCCRSKAWSGGGCMSCLRMRCIWGWVLGILCKRRLWCSVWFLMMCLRLGIFCICRAVGFIRRSVRRRRIVCMWCYWWINLMCWLMCLKLCWIMCWFLWLMVVWSYEGVSFLRWTTSVVATSRWRDWEKSCVCLWVSFKVILVWCL